MKITSVNKNKYKPATTEQKIEVQDKIKKLRKQYEKLVKGRFEFDDAQGGWFSFSFRYFPGDPVETFHITHGEVIEIPELLAFHINNTKRKIRMPHLLELKGNYRTGEIEAQPIERVSRISFIPLNSLEVPATMAV